MLERNNDEQAHVENLTTGMADFLRSFADTQQTPTRPAKLFMSFYKKGLVSEVAAFDLLEETGLAPIIVATPTEEGLEISASAICPDLPEEIYGDGPQLATFNPFNILPLTQSRLITNIHYN